MCALTPQEERRKEKKEGREGGKEGGREGVREGERETERESFKGIPLDLNLQPLTGFITKAEE